MGIWSNSKNGNLKVSVNRMNNSGYYFGPTRGLSSPKNSRRGCLCEDRNTYHRDCCNGALIEQGIGKTESPNRTGGGGFDAGFSNGFDIVLN